MLRFRDCIVLTVLDVSFTLGAAWADVAGLERVATGLRSPIFATHAPGDRSRLFIAERGGSIRILDLETGVLHATPFLTMTGLGTDGKGGFLGLTFHPEFSQVNSSGEGKFYVNVTTPSAPLTTRIREFSVSANNANVADPDSLREILRIEQPQQNHNGGWIGFSPNDKYLYIATGDGGAFDDSGTGHTEGTGNAQDITDNLLGKMLRIDVSGDDFPADVNRNYSLPLANPFVGKPGDDEIWANGLRNPFRASFDRLTGDLWIGDVGQNNREEIDFQPANSPGGENYGWRLREGTIATPASGIGGDPPPNNVEPVYDYQHGNGDFQGRAVTGGYVYRGPDPSLQNKYFFADTVSNHKWMMDTKTFVVQNVDDLLVPDVGTVLSPASFGEDGVGNLYVVAYGSGNVYRIVTNELLAGDYDADGDVDESDYTIWVESFGETSHGDRLPADGNADSVVDASDYIIWRDNLGNSVHGPSGGLLVGDYDADGEVDEADYTVWLESFGETSDGDRLPADGNANNVVDASDYTIWRDNLGNSLHAVGSGSGRVLPEPRQTVLILLGIGLAMLSGLRSARRS